MSNKASIFLTKDNEHCYEECNSPHYKYPPYTPENFLGNTIVLEMAKKNVRIVTNDNEDLIIEIEPGSELYGIIKNIRQ